MLPRKVIQVARETHRGQRGLREAQNKNVWIILKPIPERRYRRPNHGSANGSSNRVRM